MDLVIGFLFWFLVIGFWLLVFGYLVFGSGLVRVRVDCFVFL